MPSACLTFAAIYFGLRLISIPGDCQVFSRQGFVSVAFLEGRVAVQLGDYGAAPVSLWRCIRLLIKPSIMAPLLEIPSVAIAAG